MTSVPLADLLGRDPTSVRSVLVDAIALVADTSPAAVTPDLRLEELGLDSLTFTEVLIEVEDALDVEIPPELLVRLEEIGMIETVGDAFALFELDRGTS
jgi:acyl carrier protein